MHQATTTLPPMPKLRPRPGFQPNDTATTSTSSNSTTRSNNDLVVVEEEETTSRLLMKSECKSGRRKHSGSLVHSIPKFSQVKPNGRLSEVQKVLQSRIISKQQQKLMMQQQQLEQQQRAQQQRPPGMASDLLQSMIHLHEAKASTSNKQREEFKTPQPVEATRPPVKRRGRKPAKNEICHVLHTKPETSSLPLPEVTIQRILDPVKDQIRVPQIPVLSEVTITPTLVPTSSPSSSLASSPSTTSALDLSKQGIKRKRRSSSPEILAISVMDPPRPHLALTLHPRDYELAGSPPGYIFCPSSNLFLHYSTLQRTNRLHQPEPRSISVLSPDLRGKGQPRSKASNKRPNPSNDIGGANEVSICKFKFTGGAKPMLEEKKIMAMDSEGNMRFVSGSGDKTMTGHEQNKRPNPSNEIGGANEVSICKFKFTGGAKPMLEEKKMLSMDSVGNMRYVSGSGDKTLTSYEQIPRDMIKHAGASVVTDRFAALTADRMTGSKSAPLSDASSRPFK